MLSYTHGRVYVEGGDNQPILIVVSGSTLDDNIITLFKDIPWQGSPVISKGSGSFSFYVLDSPENVLNGKSFADTINFLYPIF